MAHDFKAVHGFYLNVADDAANPSIFLLPVFPESVVEVRPNAKGGSSITVRMASTETVTLDVIQGADFVHGAIRQCKELDERSC